LCAELLPQQLTRLTSLSEINCGKKSGCAANVTRPYQKMQVERQIQAKPEDIFWILVAIFVPCLQISLWILNKIKTHSTNKNKKEEEEKEKKKIYHGYQSSNR
jgi:hypothetical protein